MSTKKNQRKHSTDSSSDMGLTTKDLQEKRLAVKECPHYYELKFKDHPNGLEKVHCGTIKDVERLLEMHPDAVYSKILLPEPPETVDVPYIRVAPDLELPMQQILPESELQPLDLEL